MRKSHISQSGQHYQCQSMFSEVPKITYFLVLGNSHHVVADKKLNTEIPSSAKPNAFKYAAGPRKNYLQSIRKCLIIY